MSFPQIPQNEALTEEAQRGAVTTNAVLQVDGKQYPIHKSDPAEPGIMGIGGPNQPLKPSLDKARANDGKESVDPFDIGRDDAKDGLAPAQPQALLPPRLDGVPAGADRRAGAADDARIQPTDIRLEAGGSRAAKRWGALGGFVTGVIAGGIAGLLAGSAVPLVGNVTGLVAGAVMGGYAALGGAAVGTAFAGAVNWARGGQGQQAHLDRARESLTAQGVTLTARERDNLEALTPKEWRTHLHMPDGEMTTAADRQTFREAFVLKVARDGKDAAIRFRNDVRERPTVMRRAFAEQVIHDLGGHGEISRAHYDGSSDRVVAQRLQQSTNRDTWTGFAEGLAGPLGQEFLAQHRYEISRGDPLSSSTQQRWIGIANYAVAKQELLDRTGGRFHDVGLEAAGLTAGARQTIFKAGQRPMPSLTLRTLGRLGERETREILKAACDAQAANPDAPDPPDLERLMAEETFRIEAEQALLSMDGRLEAGDGWPADLFSGSGGPAGQVYRLCEALDRMDAALAEKRYRTGDPVVDRNRAMRVDQARGLAKLGLALQRAHVPEAQAAEMLRLELAERIAGRGPGQPDHWSPALADLDEAKQRARERLDQNGKRCAALKAALDQAEQAPGSALLADRGFLSATVDQLALHAPQHGNKVNLDALWANEAAAVKAMIEASVTPRSLLDLLSRGAQDYEEAISCDRLGVEPEGLAGLNPQQQKWVDEGFNRAEALAYHDQIHPGGFPNSWLRLDDDEDENDAPLLKSFQGSHLTPAEIQRYVDLDLAYNELTAPRYGIDRNRVGELEPAGMGNYNQVYKATYRTPFGLQERYLKEASTPQKLGSNIGMSVLDRELGAGVIVANEAGLDGDRLFLSMAAAGGSPPWRHMRPSEWTPVGRGNAAYARRRITDRNDRGKNARKQACEQYGWAGLRVNRRGDLERGTSVMERLRDDPTFRKQSVWLQIVDFLGGMKDRHNSNYMVRTSGQAENLRFEGLLGIDNDDAFGGQEVNVQSVGLPLVIDTEQRDAIVALHQKYNEDVPAQLDLQGGLGQIGLKLEVDDKGSDDGSDQQAEQGDPAPRGSGGPVDSLARLGIDPDESLAFGSRLNQLYKDVTDPQRQPKVIRPDQWNQQGTETLLLTGPSLVRRDTHPPKARWA